METISMNIISHSLTVVIWNFALQIILCTIMYRCLPIAPHICPFISQNKTKKSFSFCLPYKWNKQVACTPAWGLRSSLPIPQTHSTKWDQTWSTWISFRISYSLKYIMLCNCLSLLSAGYKMGTQTLIRRQWEYCQLTCKKKRWLCVAITS